MTFKRLSTRWASQLLALPAAILLLAAFSLAQTAPPDPEDPEEPECPPGQHYCPGDTVNIDGVDYTYEGGCCHDGTICSWGFANGAIYRSCKYEE